MFEKIKYFCACFARFQCLLFFNLDVCHRLSAGPWMQGGPRPHRIGIPPPDGPAAALPRRPSGTTWNHQMPRVGMARAYALCGQLCTGVSDDVFREKRKILIFHVKNWRGTEFFVIILAKKCPISPHISNKNNDL